MTTTSASRTTQRAAVLIKPGQIETRDVPVPVPGPGEVLVSIGSVGVCGSDVHYFETGRIGEFVVEAPLVLGHEASGRVVAVGPDVSGLDVGTRVAIEPGVPCRTCAQCRSGHYNLCPNVRFLATPPIGGAFVEQLVMPADFCHPVPDSLSDDAAALIEPLSVAVAACRSAQVGLGDEVLVTGAGPVGALTCFVAERAGATTTVCDIEPARLAAVRALGLTHVVDLRETLLAGLPERFDCVIECSGAAGVLATSLSLLRPRGRAVAVGMSADDNLQLPLSLLQTRELVVTGTFRYANTYPTAIALAASGAVPLDRFVGATFGLDGVADALRATHIAPHILKAIVRPNGTDSKNRGGFA